MITLHEAEVLVTSDMVVGVPPGTTPNYNARNPLVKLLDQVEAVRLAAEREFYLTPSFQYLFPFSQLNMYGPQGSDAQILDPTQQDNKTDFQKQNVEAFVATDTYLMRGWVSAGAWTGPFLKLSYDGGPDSKLYQLADGKLGSHIKVWMQVRDAEMSSQLIRVPYNEETDRYELELWGYPGNDLRNQLDARGQAAFDRGELLARTDLVKGSLSDFARENLDGVDMFQVAPRHTMHPINRLHIQVAWADDTETYWDSLDGDNYQYEFNMVLRGWDHYLSVGLSPNPHGGIGFLHYRNLLSNYGKFANSRELGRQLEPWMFDAFGSKEHRQEWENFFAVDYMDLHILKPNCGIGLHRHRDNQEVFFMIEGEGLMVVGDWNKFPERERCFEIRTLLPGHLAMLKGGNLHGLMNSTDENISLFMFGGYD
jgi:mannose-6-phosphate isomerase-like protein (cupin superfamily)